MKQLLAISILALSALVAVAETSDENRIRKAAIYSRTEEGDDSDSEERLLNRRRGSKERYAVAFSIGQNIGLGEERERGVSAQRGGAFASGTNNPTSRQRWRGIGTDNVDSVTGDFRGPAGVSPGFGSFTGGSEYDDPEGGGGGGRGGRGGGTTPGTTLGARAGYLFTKTTNGSFSVNHLIPSGESNQSQFPQTQSTTLRAGVGGKPTGALGLNASLSHRIEYEERDPETEDPTAGAAAGGRSGFGNRRPKTIAQLRSRYSITRPVSVFLNLGYAFSDGATDPAAGVQARYTLYRAGKDALSGNASLQATAPFSPRSQEQAKLTTITFSAGPSFQSGDLTLSLQGFVSLSFYQPDGSPEGDFEEDFTGRTTNAVGDGNGFDGGFGSGSRARELASSGGTASLNYKLDQEFAANTAYGISSTYREDETVSYRSQFTVIGLSYRPGDFTITGNVSLISGRANDEELLFPDQPFIGLGLTYTFGNRGALRGGGGGGGGGR